MKIALYVPSWPPRSAANGIVTYAAQIVPALRRLGHIVYVLTADLQSKTPDEFTIDLAEFRGPNGLFYRLGRKLVPQNPYGSLAPVITRAVSALVRNKGIDVFEIEESFGWSYSVSQLRSVPVVVRLHGPWFLNGQFDPVGVDTRAGRSREFLEHRGIRNADLVTSPSKVVLETVRKHYNLALDNSVVIPNAIEAVNESELWQAEKCPPSTLLFVGRFDGRKGGDLVVRAFAALAATDPRVKLTFVGPDLGVANADGSLVRYAEFSKQNVSDEVHDRIDFRGALSHMEVVALRKARYATVVASQYEILPYAVLEAMAYGCPLVATSVGGIPELIQDMRNGLLIPSQDIGALVSACRVILDQPNLAARLGKRAWQDCHQHYSPDQLARDTVAAYHRARELFRRSI
jgi:glycosyltransferase involved in cell wall biosynthesis